MRKPGALLRRRWWAGQRLGHAPGWRPPHGSAALERCRLRRPRERATTHRPSLPSGNGQVARCGRADAIAL